MGLVHVPFYSTALVEVAKSLVPSNVKKKHGSVSCQDLMHGVYPRIVKSYTRCQLNVNASIVYPSGVSGGRLAYLLTCSWYSMVENCGMSSGGTLFSEMAA